MSSASSLAAQLAASNRLNQNTTSHTAYRGPNVQDLRADPSVSAVADQVLQEVLRRAPFLDPRGPAVYLKSPLEARTEPVSCLQAVGTEPVSCLQVAGTELVSSLLIRDLLCQVVRTLIM